MLSGMRICLFFKINPSTIWSSSLMCQYFIIFVHILCLVIGHSYMTYCFTNQKVSSLSITSLIFLICQVLQINLSTVCKSLILLLHLNQLFLDLRGNELLIMCQQCGETFLEQTLFTCHISLA